MFLDIFSFFSIAKSCTNLALATSLQMRIANCLIQIVGFTALEANNSGDLFRVSEPGMFMVPEALNVSILCFNFYLMISTCPALIGDHRDAATPDSFRR